MASTQELASIRLKWWIDNTFSCLATAFSSVGSSPILSELNVCSKVFFISVFSFLFSY